MDPRDPRFGKYQRIFENQWLVSQRAQEMVRRNMPSDALSRRLPNNMPARMFNIPTVQAQFRARPQIASVFSRTDRFAGTFGSRLSAAVRSIVQGTDMPVARSGIAKAVRALPKAQVFRAFQGALGEAAVSFIEMMEDARVGDEMLEQAGYGFADHLWTVVYLSSFADLPANAPREAVVTNRLRSFTASEEFAESLLEDLGASRMLSRRSRVIELALEAHARREYELSVPPLFAQIEGAVGDAMFLKDLVVRREGKYFLVGPDGEPKVNKNGNRLPAITLSPAVSNANLEEQPHLTEASEFLSGVLVQRRNDVMHGRDVGYGKAKLSVQALLVLAVLAESVAELEEGE